MLKPKAFGSSSVCEGILAAIKAMGGFQCHTWQCSSVWSRGQYSCSVSSHGLCSKARPCVLFVLPPGGGLRSRGIYFYL